MVLLMTVHFYLVKLLKVSVVDMFKDQSRSSRDRILDNALQGDDVRSSSQIFQNFNFSFDLLLLDRLQRFDDALLVVGDVDRLKHFAVFTATQLPDKLKWKFHLFEINIDIQAPIYLNGPVIFGDFNNIKYG